MSLGSNWATHQLAELLAAVDADGDEATATRGAVERAAQALDADIGALVAGGELVAAVGVPAGDAALAAAVAAAARDPAARVELPGLGGAASARARVNDADLVLLRLGDEPFDTEERHLLGAMARVLRLALGLLRAAADQRARADQQAAIAALGRRALEGADPDLLLLEAEGAAALALGLDQEEAATILWALSTDGDADAADYPDGHFLQAIANVVVDAEARRRAEERVRHQALHDPLTRLPNRTLLVDRVAHALARAGRENTRVGVLFLDMDGFKGINDTEGHAAGDELLRALAARLGQGLRAGDTLARFGGDEFVVLCEDVDEAESVAVAQRLAASLATPLIAAGRERIVSASIGVALSGPQTESAEALIRDADVAMYRAKQRGTGGWELFDERVRTSIRRRLETVEHLRAAVGRGEIRVEYQPIVELASGRLRGLESLVRWQHPQRGRVSPAEFVPLAEETGQIDAIGRAVLDAACRQAAAWERAGRLAPGVHVGVNLSAHQLTPELPATVTQTLIAAGLAPERLMLEITESVLIGDADAALAILDAVAGLGVSLVLDDFGTGYSSLAYLQRLPVTAVKIDRGFVAGLGSGARDEAIVGAILSMAEALGLGVVAEGVETPAQAERLHALGCPHAQGFLFARPSPPELLEPRLEQGGALAPAST